MACFVCIGGASAAVRTTNSPARSATATPSRTTAQRGNSAKSVTSRATENQSRSVSARTATSPQRTTTSRNAVQTGARTTTQRNNTTTKSRAAVNIVRATQQSARTAPVVRTATKSSSRVSRAATPQGNTFSTGYNSCRDAYFTCMDQFCATADDTYRRCICSSRLGEIKKKQRALNDASDQIQNFHDLNIDVIPKTAAEVNAMLSASDGEFAASIAKDTSDSAQKLAGISTVLAKTKSKSLSTAGTLDIAGDINAIWATTDLASGVNIANLTGETLYNAVHSQCAELVADRCESKSTLNMVVSAYGMYIENDCTLLATSLGKKKDSANATIRETEREMNNARLDNYNAHNATSINDCVAKVRADITRDTACGTGYVHCLDISGLYLNKTTGEPIYTADFYQLETMVSLSGDVLTNQTNRLLVAELNRKRAFAEKSLSTCEDLSDEVWDEFMRQAIAEIYQGQQSRIRQVKDECLDVVNKCYDRQTASLRDFSNADEQLLLGSQLELSEELCVEKLNACSNLYGGGPNGLQELLNTMYNITSQKIAQNCLEALKEYAADICATPSNDTLHAYPYACRVYAPGEQRYAIKRMCHNIFTPDAVAFGSSSTTKPYWKETNNNTSNEYYCPNKITYSACKQGYFLSDCLRQDSNGTISIDNTKYRLEDSGNITPRPGNRCIGCRVLGDEDAFNCPGDADPENTHIQYASCPTMNFTPIPVYDYSCDNSKDSCCDYPGSLYQKMVRYAIQACMRPSETTISDDEDVTPISAAVLQDVNMAMDSIRVAMSNELQAECERLGGYWVTTQHLSREHPDGDGNTVTDPISGSNLELHNRFYQETGANRKWGYCAEAASAQSYYEIEIKQSNSTTSGGQ